MKFFCFFFLGLFFFFVPVKSLATVTWVSVSGASNDNFSEVANTGDLRRVYAGLAGDECVSVNNGTCNSCDSGQSPCNESRITDDTILSVKFSSDTSQFDEAYTEVKIVAFLEGTNLNQDLIDELEATFGLSNGTTKSGITKGGQLSAGIKWGDICGKVLSGVSCENFKQTGFEADLAIGLSFDDDSVTSSSDVTEIARIRIYIQGVDNGDSEHTPLCPADGAGTKEGFCDFELLPGDQKAYLNKLAKDENNNSFRRGTNSTSGITPPNLEFRWAYFYFDSILGSPAGNAIDLSSPKFILEYDRESGAMKSNQLLNSSGGQSLENGTTYYFKVATVDLAKNISFLTPNSVATGSAWPLSYTVTPGEVYGLLEESDCFVATVTFGSSLAPQLNVFREIRDHYLLKSIWGRVFVDFYYKNGPHLARLILEFPVLKFVFLVLLWPLWFLGFLFLNLGSFGFIFLLFLVGLCFWIANKNSVKKIKKKEQMFFLLFFSFVFLFKAEMGLSSEVSEEGQLSEMVFAENEGTPPPPEPPYPGVDEDSFGDKTILNHNQSDEDKEKKQSHNESKKKLHPTDIRGSKKIQHPFADEGLLRITKDKKYIYQVKKSPQTHMVSIRLAQVNPFEIKNSRGVSFKDMYGETSNMGLVIDWEWPWINPFGRLGYKIGLGFIYKKMPGRIDQGGQLQKSFEQFSLLVVPLELSLIYRFQFSDEPWFVPYAQGGVGYVGMLEYRDDGKSTHKKGLPSTQAGGGLSVLLNGISDSMMHELDYDYGINNLWLTFDYRLIKSPSKEGFDLSTQIVSVGITMDY